MSRNFNMEVSHIESLEFTERFMKEACALFIIDELQTPLEMPFTLSGYISGGYKDRFEELEKRLKPYVKQGQVTIEYHEEGGLYETFQIDKAD